jgi:ATPase subunit of ABC transporter with duplicated ATPase domains
MREGLVGCVMVVSPKKTADNATRCRVALTSLRYATHLCTGAFIVISLDAVTKQHGRQILFLDASATVERGEKVGLVGPNGAGKTTVFRLITGEEEADGGQVSVERGVRIGYFSQDVGEMQGMSVLAATLDGAGPVAAAMAELKELEGKMADPDAASDIDKLIERFGEVQSRFDTLGGYALEGQAREILAGLGFDPVVVDDDVGKLSGGWKMRVALARILLMRPDLLLLDEPTNHLDLESIIWLEQFLARFEGAIVMTSHDREFMNRVVDKIIEIDGGEIVTYSGNVEFYERQRKEREREQQAQFDRQQKMLEKELRFIERFKARASHASQVQSRIKKIDKIDKLEPPRTYKRVEFEFRKAPRSGDDVVRLNQVKKRFGTRLVTDLDLLIRRTERWCIMGQNGAGKSTLLKLVVGALSPDEGQVTVGASVKVGYFAQHAMDVLDGEKTIFETLQSDFPTSSQGQLRALAGCFGFPGDDIEKRVRILSGGEKARLVLARMLFDPPNLLVLDEPTNHLDTMTKDMLVDALSKFEGTMLFVSHDRRFLSALSNRVLEISPDGAHVYGGGYTEYVAESGHEAPGLRS